MRIAAVMAHPDDAEIWCGGTLALHAARGDSVSICILSYDHNSPRGKEALQGGRRLGCNTHLLGLTDTAIRDTDEAVNKLLDVLFAIRPEIIITHWFDDAHPDHEATFRIVTRTVLRSTLHANQQDLEVIPRLFCCDTYNSLGLHGPFVPNRLVDVGSVWTTKTEAIQAHGSQFLSNYIPMIEAQCRLHGEKVGVRFCEGFHFVPSFGRQDIGQRLGKDRSYDLEDPAQSDSKRRNP
jgi:LmbE family N-acetylglucosaminyl deacetylase